MNGLEFLSSRATLLLQFTFTAAFAGIGPYTSAIVFRALKISSPNPLERRRALIAFTGCCMVDTVCLCHLVLFLWCCNRTALRPKLHTSRPTQKDVEKRKSNIQRLRISQPVSVVKNPPASSASEKALMDAKAAILGEQPLYDRSAAPPSSLLLSVFEDEPDETQITVHEISVHSGAVRPALALTTSSISGSGRASPLSTSPEFEKQYPRLSQDFNGARASQEIISSSQTLPTKTSQSLPNGSRNSGNNNLTSPTSVHSSQQHIQPVQPSLHLHSISSLNFSSMPLHPSSLRNSVSQTQPPAPVHLSNSIDSTHSRNYSNPFPASVPSTRLILQSSILPTDSPPSMSRQTSFGSRPRNFSLPPSVSCPVSPSVSQTPTLVQQPYLRQHNPQAQTPPISTAGESRPQTASAPSSGPGFQSSETYSMNQTFPMIGTAISTPDVSRPSSVRSSNVQDSAMSR